jgi:hypothetical protein
MPPPPLCRQHHCLYCSCRLQRLYLGRAKKVLTTPHVLDICSPTGVTATQRLSFALIFSIPSSSFLDWRVRAETFYPNCMPACYNSTQGRTSTATTHIHISARPRVDAAILPALRSSIWPPLTSSPNRPGSHLPRPPPAYLPRLSTSQTHPFRKRSQG